MDIIKTDGFENIYEVDCFLGEFLRVVKEPLKKPGKKMRYQQWLDRMLAILDELGYKALNLPHFEQLTNVDPKLFSIRYPKTPKNPRVLYFYLEGRKVLLLTAFQENNESDYNNGIARAKQRLKQLKSEGKL